jgi:Zn-dependent peptidase ImmA (M78 family)
MLFHDWVKERFALPTCNLPDLRGEDPETAALELRHGWGQGERPIRNMVHLLESKGVSVFSILETNDIDAFSLWRDDTPFVFLNTKKSAERSRFDAAHELGHLVLHRGVDARGKDAESQANQFASAFLMPRGSVLANAPIFPSLSILISLKKQWIVSVAALTYRLHALRLIKDWHYRTLCIEIARNGHREREPEPASPEMSLIFGKVFQMLRSEGVTRADVARELKFSREDLDEVIFGLVVTGIQGGRRTERRDVSDRSLHVVE